MMEFKKEKVENFEYVKVVSVEEKIRNGSDFNDIIANADSKYIFLDKNMFVNDFYRLKTGIAGDILQKVSNYNLFLAIIGDFSQIDSKSLRDFIYESNKNKRVLFVNTDNQAIKIFS